MRKFPLLSASFLALTMMAGCPADDSGDGSESNADDATTTADDGTTMTGEDGGCFPAPEECVRFVECLEQIIPGQGAIQEPKYGAEGSCWCGSEEEALGCYNDCVGELEKALTSNPTANACHASYCTLDELDPTQPYGPPDNGACADFEWNGSPYAQIAMDGPFGIPGSFCSPACSGVANACPESSQTSADGTCYISMGDTSYCVSRCYIDSEAIGGTQCQCGATCQPQGGADGEGNLRGICSFVD